MKMTDKNRKSLHTLSSLAVRSNLQDLMGAMGITDYVSIRTPEQNVILDLLAARGAKGLSTRELADLCGLSIYKVRHLLLPLEKEGHILRSKIIKHHRWFIAESFYKLRRKF